MTESGLIVIGSGPAGVSAAEAFREHNADLPVTIVTDDPHLPYARPPLSKDYLRGGHRGRRTARRAMVQ
ncbi:NAD(P)/FAD-dependent oxidoreductase [Mycolicibacterium komossense]|uniref:NAD(P)/FAD-dependent oxidoreductase n=1 Tax=Mycolicibacterium komossense TaxID=1779 RepID=UPI0021F3A12A|nr:NAD(P)/FAD-dependent oxidoreductase [Mycolicibacterium komossense]